MNTKLIAFLTSFIVLSMILVAFSFSRPAQTGLSSLFRNETTDESDREQAVQPEIVRGPDVRVLAEEIQINGEFALHNSGLVLIR